MTQNWCEIALQKLADIPGIRLEQVVSFNDDLKTNRLDEWSEHFEAKL